MNEELVGLLVKTCSYLKDDKDESQKAKITKKCIIERKLLQRMRKLFRSKTTQK